ncbi:MAG TPA: Flp pilus assembly complex ATPase component TadA [Candidatus Eisenbergiella merdipullorum]|uniref:Flp pilus assembly complex ATPase component TadA n=1 Tax=Candidatus Eisenbergiella merdipullorum TaxID=2838553 RepID=A0A9D2L1N8_9FIRM|nr:Flp pilus assembly complex ATPase component TadA [Candidatus Eisenbergiella merdipullorum]
MEEQKKEDYLKIKEETRRELLESMDFTREISDDELQEAIAAKLRGRQFAGRLDIYERAKLGKELFFALRGLDILQELIEDEQVTEIMINGMEGIFVERAGRLFAWPGGFETKEKLQDVIQQIVAGCNRTVNEASPIVDARLKNGSRVNVVLDPVALNGPVVTIRRFPDEPISIRKLVESGSITQEACLFLEKLVKAKYNIFISGGTGSGKTTFLNALAEFIPEDERLITIEDSAELQIRGIANLVRLETRNANTDGCRPINIRDLIRTALRMRPDRIIIGEVRGAEAADLIGSALNCGHDGSMSTGHANSAADMLTRLETMMLMGVDIPLSAIRRQIASGVDVIVHLGRLRDKTRKVLEIAEVAGFENGEIRLSTLFAFEETGKAEGEIKGMLVRKGELIHANKLKMAGIAPA